MALVLVFPTLMAHQGARCGPANGAQRAAQQHMACKADWRRPYAGAELCVVGVGGAAAQ